MSNIPASCPSGTEMAGKASACEGCPSQVFTIFYYDEKLLQHFVEIVRLEKRSASDIQPKSISIVVEFAAAKNASELMECFRNYAQRVKLDLIQMLLKLLSVLSP